MYSWIEALMYIVLPKLLCLPSVVLGTKSWLRQSWSYMYLTIELMMILARVKGIISSENNIFLWYESEDNKNKLTKKKKKKGGGVISKISFNSNFMHDYVHWHCLRTVLNQISSTDFLSIILFHTEMISAWFLWGNLLLGSRAASTNCAEKSNFWLFFKGPSTWNLAVCL